MSTEIETGEAVQVQPEEPKVRKPRQPKTQAPSVGRIVHFTTPNDEARPALILQVNEDESVDLQVFNHLGVHYRPLVPFSEGPHEGHWSWPPTV